MAQKKAALGFQGNARPALASYPAACRIGEQQLSREAMWVGARILKGRIMALEQAILRLLNGSPTYH
jgi:hypothetical protein